MAGPALVGIFWFAALFSPALCYPYHELCFDGKMLPVNLKEDWQGYDCFDKEGNKYQEYATLISCCGCLTVTCHNHNITHTPPQGSYETPESNWTLARSDSCCEDCNGTMFPAGAIMNVTEEVDEKCEKITRTTKCVYVDVNGDEGKAVAEVSFGFKGCCTDETTNRELGYWVLDKKTCSNVTCGRFEGNKYASWVSTLVFDDIGCNCCIDPVTGELVQEGKVCLGIKDSKCCEGECMVKAVVA